MKKQKPSNLVFIPLIASLILHLLVASLLWLQPRVSPKLSSITRVDLAVEFKTRNTAIRRRSHNHIKTLDLKTLTPRLRISPSFKQQSEDDQPSIPWDETQAYDRLSVIDLDGGISAKEDAFIMRLWQLIDREIENNPFLSEYGHTGQVFLKFEIRNFPKDFLASAQDRVLKVIAARAVRRALKKDSNELKFPKSLTVIQARFTWTNYEACTKLQGHRGHLLSFCHYAENKLKSFSRSEKIGTYTGAVLNHGPWAVQDIKEYNREQSHRKTHFDPFEELKRDPDWNL